MRLAPAALLLALAAPALAQDAEDDRRPPLFLVEDADSRVYLLGSVHALPPDALPLPAHVEAAYAEAETVAFELDLDEATAGAPAMLAAGTDEETVAEALSPEQRAAFDARLGEIGLPPGALDAFEPWLAALTYGVLAIEQAGASTDGGVDEHLFRRAQADGKALAAFETLELQTAAFDGLPVEAQVALLMESVEDDRDPADVFAQMVGAWATGDDEGLAEMMNEGMGNPAVFEALLAGRNRAWVPQVEALLARDGEDALVVVGAGHLVGRESVVELLREAGHEVVRIDD